MVYTFVCDDCNLVPVDVFRTVAEVDEPEVCQSCNKPMRRVYYPIPNTYNSAHDTPQYNPAFGKVIKSRSHLKEELRRVNAETGREFVEVGNDKPGMDRLTPPQHSYDDDLTDRIKI